MLYFSIDTAPQIKIIIPSDHKETVYLLSTKANAEALYKSIKDVKEGKNLIELDPTA